MNENKKPDSERGEDKKTHSGNYFFPVIGSMPKAEAQVIQKVEKAEKELIEDKAGVTSLSDTELLKKRKENILKFLKAKVNWIVYIFLAILVFISVRIRTRNLSGLKDITTDTWTLGPDLDPFLFLRWAKHIVETGSLMVLDTLRYSPLGYDTKGELILHPYLIAWFHKIAVIFGSDSITHSAVLYPVFMFALTVIAFFLFTRKIFVNSLGIKKANIIALIASFFLSVLPVLLPRTIAGIPEKESAAFLFMFLAFYFFLSAWEAKKLRNGVIFAIFAGASTAAMALIWGGFAFLFLTIGPTAFIVFLLGIIDKHKFYIYLAWILSSFALMSPFSTRYSISNLLISTTTGIPVIILLIIAFHLFIFKPYLKRYFTKGILSKIPSRVLSTLITGITLLILISIILGPSFIISQVNNLISNLVTPATGRLLRTVAENRQPFFTEWSGSFGPFVKGIPLFFWLFFTGSIFLFYKLTKILKKKEQIILTLTYTIFLITTIFSRYSPTSTFNGTNNASLFLYTIGFLTFLISLGYYYYQYHKNEKQSVFKNLKFPLILIFTIFFLSILATRGAVRLIMVLVPSVSILVGYFIVETFSGTQKVKPGNLKIVAWILVAIIIISAAFSGYKFYQTVNSQAAGHIPSVYTQQWQKAMSWTRENTPKDAVFGHWWDYGYWLQSIGERATVLDGGNAIGYWNHLMGRHALTGPDEKDALEFLYAHDTTHFLIDSTDIGKYPAFSSIGSNADFDRRSGIATFFQDNSQISETKNGTIIVYTGGTGLDEDILYEENESRIFLPAGKAGLGAIIVEKDNSGKLISQPLGIFVYQNIQHNLPLRYAYSNKEFIDFGSGVESGIFLFSRVSPDRLDIEGAALYLSERTVNSQLARIYLYNDENSNFKLVHTEDDFVVSQIKPQNPDIGDFVFYNGFRGPIKIWEINYPEDIEYKEEYVLTSLPEEEDFRL